MSEYKMLKTLWEFIPDIAIVALSGTLLLYLYSEHTEILDCRSNNIEIKIVKPSQSSLNNQDVGDGGSQTEVRTEVLTTDDWWPFVDETTEEYTEWTRR